MRARRLAMRDTTQGKSLEQYITDNDDNKDDDDITSDKHDYGAGSLRFDIGRRRSGSRLRDALDDI